MQRYFSPSTGGFYSDFVNGSRQIEAVLTPAEQKAGKRPTLIDNPACTVPADAVLITEERFAQLLAAQETGKVIKAAGNKPIAVEAKPDPDVLVAARRRQRDSLLAASDWTQMPDSPLDGSTKAAWAIYRQALRDLDMTGMDWPVEPGSEGA